MMKLPKYHITVTTHAKLFQLVAEAFKAPVDCHVCLDLVTKHAAHLRVASMSFLLSNPFRHDAIIHY